MHIAANYALQYRAGLSGHYKEVLEEMERVTRSISQLRCVDERQQSTSTASTVNLTFYVLICIMLVYVFRQAD